MSDYHDLRIEKRMSGEEHETRMAAARARAEWDLGDPSWAGVIIAAYMEPADDTANLAEESA